MTLCQASALHSATCGDDPETENAPCPNAGTHTVMSRSGVKWLLCRDCTADLETLVGLAGRVLDARSSGHPDPRFCKCGHHADGHTGERCYGADETGKMVARCDCLAYVPANDQDRVAREALLSHREGIPTSADLERWAGAS